MKKYLIIIIVASFFNSCVEEEVSAPIFIKAINPEVNNSVLLLSWESNVESFDVFVGKNESNLKKINSKQLENQNNFELYVYDEGIYYWKVRAYDDDRSESEKDSEILSFVYQNSVKVSNLRIKNPNNENKYSYTNLELDWYGKADYYDVYLGTAKYDLKKHNTQPIREKNYSFEFLQASTTYYCQVVAFGGVYKVKTPVVEFKTADKIDINLISPLNQASHIDYSQIDLRWSANNEFYSYKLYLSTDPENLSYESTIYNSSIQIRNLKIGETYYWKVVGNTNNASYSSSINSFTTQDKSLDLLYPQSNLNSVDYSNIEFSWDSELMYFDFYLGKDSSNLNLESSTLSEKKYKVSNLDINTNYYWKVVGKNSAYSKSIKESEIRKFTTSSVELNIQSPTDNQSHVDFSTVHFSWTSSLDYYDLYFGTDINNLTKIESNSASTNFQKSFLEPETTYYWKIVGKTSTWSDASKLESSIYSFTTKKVSTSEMVEVKGLSSGTFYIDKYETTCQQYVDFLNSIEVSRYGHSYIDPFSSAGVTYINVGSINVPIRHNGDKFYFSPNSIFPSQDCPIGYVTWEGARAYAKWKGGRLPSHNEWEYAAQGGQLSNGFTYSGSNNLNEVGWYSSNSSYQTHSVGSKKSNELGIFDMTGNVNEYCSISGSSASEYVRGGGYQSSSSNCTLSFRKYESYSQPDLGFRIIIEK